MSKIINIKARQILDSRGFPTVEVEGHTYMMLQDRDIEYIIEEWEEETPASSIIQTQPNIIL